MYNMNIHLIDYLLVKKGQCTLISIKSILSPWNYIILFFHKLLLCKN